MKEMQRSHLVSSQKLQFTSPLRQHDMNGLIIQRSTNRSHQSFYENNNLSSGRLHTHHQHSHNIQFKQRSIKTNFKQNVAPQESYQAISNVKNNTCQKTNNILKFHYRNSQTANEKLMSSTFVDKPGIQIKPFFIENLYQSSYFSTPILPQISNQPNPTIMIVSNFIRIRELGKGKFGTVWLVRHKMTNFVCAMKIVKKSVVRQQKIEYQIAKEIRIHNALKHMNIIAFYGFFDDQQNVYILTEYATGGQVYSLLKKDFRLKEHAVENIVRETADGLHFMHNCGYIHRDIKPQNLIIQFNTIKICDLGWTAQCSDRQMRKSICGTPLYYSPELVKQTEHNSAIDVWSLGILAYELLIGKIPFRIWSQFDLPMIIQQEVTFPDYVDLQQHTKRFILNCLNKNNLLRPSIALLKCEEFLRKKQMDINFNLFNEFGPIF